MTPQEALAQALHDTGHSEARRAAPDWSDDPCDYCKEDAAAILDALREAEPPADIIVYDDEWYADLKDRDRSILDAGAQQERERLREHRPLVDRDAGLYCSCGKWSDNYDYTEWWEHLADPEPDR